MMDYAQNVKRIKDNLLLIKPERFDALVSDKGYWDSFVYFIACMVASIPFELAVVLATGGNPSDLLLSVPVSILISLVVGYAIFALQHLFLRAVGGQATRLQSVQVFIYGTTPSIIFGGIPFLGVLASLAGLANIVVGSSRVHRISVWRSIAAIIIIPTILLIVAFVALFSLMGAPAA
jgi:hypothetical protein